MHKTLTSDEFYDKYGDVKVKFSSYYKHTFTYCAVLESGNKIFAHCGGDHESIYRHDVAVDVEKSIASLFPYSVDVRDQNGNLVEEYTSLNYW